MIFTTSWDDGYKADLRIAALLEKYGAKGTFYVCPQAQHDQEMITEVDIKALSMTQEIGAHTIHHPKLSRIPLDDAKKEIAESKAWVESVTGKDCLMFCYPYGDFNDAVAKLTSEAGFISARTVEVFKFSATDKERMGTSVHLYPFPWRPKFTRWWHYIDLLGPLRVRWTQLNSAHIPLIARRNWLTMAKATFMEAHKTQQPFFHLWGHAFELDRYELWGTLDEFLAFVAEHEVTHMTNGELATTLFPS